MATSRNPLPTRARPPIRMLMAAAATLAVLATAACGGGSRVDQQAGGAPPVTDKPVELSVAWWGGPARADNTQKVLDLYTKAHPNVTFKTQWQGYSGYYDKINTTAAGGNAPDIIQIDNRVLREYSNKRLIADLGPWVGSTLKVDAVNPKLLGTGKVDDKLYAMPAAANTQALAIDKTVLEPLGLLPPETGWATWEEFGTWSAKVTAALGGKVWGVRDESANISLFEPWLRQRGKQLYDGQKPGFTVEDVTTWLTMWAGFRASGAASPAEIAQPANAGDISKNTVAAKTTAATFSYDNQFTELSKATDHALLLVPIPGPAVGAYSRPSQFYTAYAKGKNIGTAVDVINFFINDEAAGAALGTERGLPPSSKVSDAISPQFNDQLKYVVAFDKKITEKAGPNPPVPAQGDSKMSQLMISAGENAGFGRKTPQEAAAEFVSQATSELERAGR